MACLLKLRCERVRMLKFSLLSLQQKNVWLQTALLSVQQFSLNMPSVEFRETLHLTVAITAPSLMLTGRQPYSSVGPIHPSLPFKNHFTCCWIWGSHSGYYEEYSFLWCSSVQVRRRFGGITSSSFRIQGRKHSKAGGKQSFGLSPWRWTSYRTERHYISDDSALQLCLFFHLHLDHG